jgi:flavin reductase (DIM6/NTAB) family NADH-FMN oxidoreductase RutF
MLPEFIATGGESQELGSGVTEEDTVEKVEIGAKTFLYPMPTTLVGANVNGKPNFLTVAYCGIMDHHPPLISVALSKSHYTNIGIRQNGAFSVNFPSASMVKITDHCGLVSGHKADKSGLFKTFYGKLKSAPMIRECPLCLECKVIQTLGFSIDEVFIGEIVAAYSEERFLTDGLPDIRKMDPIVFSMHDNNYWRVGEHLGRAWSIGKEFKTK